MDRENKIKLLGLHLGVTGVTLVACVIIALVGMFFSWMFESPDDIYINYETSRQNEFSGLESLSYGFHNYHFNETEEPEIVFSEQEKKLEGFKEYKKGIYSPIIMYVNENVLSADSGFNLSNADKTINYKNVKKNLNTILTAIEENKTWEDLGVNSKCLEGTVTLAVPDEYNPYRDLVKDLFMINLTTGEINESNYDELSERAEKILEKCIQIEDPLGYLVANKGKKVIVVAPEFIIEDNEDGVFRKVTHSADILNDLFTPVYPTRTTAIFYNVYIKEEVVGNDVEEKKEHMDYVALNNPVSNTIGFRTKNGSIDGFDSKNLVEDVSVMYIDKNLKGSAK